MIVRIFGLANVMRLSRLIYKVYIVKNLICALAVALVSYGGSAGAATVTVGTDTYEITTVSGSFEDNKTYLTGLDWWGNETLATELATAFQTPLVNFAFETGYFGFARGDVKAAEFFNESVTQIKYPSASSDIYVYAGGYKVSEVPLPAALPLLLAGIGGLGFIGRRRQKAKVS